MSDKFKAPTKKTHGPVCIPDSPKMFVFLTPMGLKNIPYTQTKNPPPSCSNLGRMEACFRRVVWARSPFLSLFFFRFLKNHKLVCGFNPVEKY